ncbi:MAG: thermonuclease family protein, partial [Nanoarchaeota archaeon]|nr:thermonuclease family protein [Nanoarchaeota archaeon]
AGVVVGLMLVWQGCGSGGCGCGCRRDPQPKYKTHGPFAVRSVDSATSLTCTKGRKGKREQQVILAWIEGPGAGRAEEARAKLEGLIGGGEITVEVHRRGPVESAPIGATPEARKPLVGTVVNSSGLNCNRAMVSAGLATCTPEAPESWKAAEAEAKKAKLGLWE